MNWSWVDAACGFYLGGVMCMALPGIVRHWRGEFTAFTFFYSTLLWPIAMLVAAWRAAFAPRVCIAGSAYRPLPSATSLAEHQALIRQFATQCIYRVDPGEEDDLEPLCAQAGIKIDEVNALNGDKSPKEYWRVGQEVTLPRALCLILEERDKKKASGP